VKLPKISKFDKFDGASNLNRISLRPYSDLKHNFKAFSSIVSSSEKPNKLDYRPGRASPIKDGPRNRRTRNISQDSTGSLSKMRGLFDKDV